jgi:chromatin remodeling complex protein RSC6
MLPVRESGPPPWEAKKNMLLAGRIKEGGGKRGKKRKKEKRKKKEKNIEGERMSFSPYLTGILTHQPIQTARALVDKCSQQC